jgi:hypothetical protein
MDDSTLSESVLQRYPRLSRVIGWASLVTLVLGIITSLLGYIADLRRHLFELLGIGNLVFLHYAMATLMALLFLAGYMFGGLWLYKRFVNLLNVGPRRLIAGMGVIAGLFLAIGTGYFAISGVEIPGASDVRKPLNETSDAWRTELLALGVHGGGLRTSQSDPAAPPQVWCTAQSLVAILARPSILTLEDAQQIKEDFDYIEKARLAGNEGWGYMAGVDWGVTEISAWVALAYAASMEPHIGALIWGTDSPAVPLQRLLRELDLLRQRQLPNGAWPPIRDTDKEKDGRTYSTVMTVWAVLEAKRRKIFDDRDSRTYNDAAEKGIRWLLGMYNPYLQSWVPSPTRPGQLESFPGLTAQVLFVLGRAKPYFPFLDRDPNYERAEKAFLVPEARKALPVQDPRSRPVASNDRTHDSDRYLSNPAHMVESSTYLWAPWSLAFCAEAHPGTNLLEDTRNMCGAVIGRANELISFAEDEPFIYVMAESLLAINLYLQTDAATSANTSAAASSVSNTKSR